jgi:hypothetical protein
LEVVETSKIRGAHVFLMEDRPKPAFGRSAAMLVMRVVEGGSCSDRVDRCAWGLLGHHAHQGKHEHT